MLLKLCECHVHLGLHVQALARACRQFVPPLCYASQSSILPKVWWAGVSGDLFRLHSHCQYPWLLFRADGKTSVRMHICAASPTLHLNTFHSSVPSFRFDAVSMIGILWRRASAPCSNTELIGASESIRVRANSFSEETNSECGLPCENCMRPCSGVW